MRTRFALLIVDSDGENHYVRNEPADDIAVFTSLARANKAAEFWRDGLGDEVQSVNVVKIPEGTRREGARAEQRTHLMTAVRVERD